MSDVLELGTANPAEMVARRLSRWQIMDMVFIHRNGRMEVGRTSAGKTRAPIQSLIDAGVLMAGATGDYVLPGKRFEPVLKALHGAGLIATLEIPKPAWKQ